LNVQHINNHFHSFLPFFLSLLHTKYIISTLIITHGISIIQKLSFIRACDAIQPSKDPLEVPVGPVTELRAKKFKEAFNQDTWAKVDFKRICNNKEQALINLIHV